MTSNEHIPLQQIETEKMEKDRVTVQSILENNVQKLLEKALN